MKSIFALFLLPLFAAAASPNRGADLLGQLPLRFEANRGQWPASVRFAARSAEHGIVLTGTEAVVQAAPGREVRIRPAGANPAPAVEGVERLASGSTYLLGRDRSGWHGDVPHFNAVAYRGVYPGVDLLYKGTGRRLEYDFLVAPHANAEAIRLEFPGSTGLSIDEDGSLRIAAGDAELRQPLPFAYQEHRATGTRTQIAARYRLLPEQRAAFELGAYDPALPLVIDPVLIATYFGGDNMDVATTVAVDTQGQVWVAGYTTSATLPIAGNPYFGERVGNLDIFVAKFNPNVSGGDALVWSTYLGGDAADKPTAMALSTDGFLYLTGNTESANFPLAGTPAQGALNGPSDAFLVRLSRSQQGTDALWYGTYFGGEQQDFGTAVAVDAQNRPYIAGYSTTGIGFTFSSGAFQAANRGGYDAFFAVFRPDSASTLVYSTCLGGARTDVATGIAVDGSGIVHLTGYTMSDDFPATSNSYRTTYAGRGDVFYARADITKAGLDGLLYATYIGGGDADIAYAMTAGADGRVYVAGYTFSNDFPLIGNPVRTARAGGSDVFLLRIDPSAPGSDPITYSTYLGGAGSELAYGIALDSAGRVALTGYTESDDFPAIGNALQPRTGGAIDAFLTVVDLNAAAPLIYSSYVGGDSPDVGYQVASDTRGNLYMVGSTTSRKLGSPNVFQADLSRYTDGLLVRFNLCENTAACQVQGLLPASTGASQTSAAEACLAPGGPSLSLSGAACAETPGGGTLCTRKVCSAGKTDGVE